MSVKMSRNKKKKSNACDFGIYLMHSFTSKVSFGIYLYLYMYVGNARGWGAKRVSNTINSVCGVRTPCMRPYQYP